MTDCFIGEHEDFNQYVLYAISSTIMSWYNYPASVVNQNVILIELSCWRAHMALMLPLINIEILANMAHMEYHPR